MFCRVSFACASGLSSKKQCREAKAPVKGEGTCLERWRWIAPAARRDYFWLKYRPLAAPVQDPGAKPRALQPGAVGRWPELSGAESSIAGGPWAIPGIIELFAIVVGPGVVARVELSVGVHQPDRAVPREHDARKPPVTSGRVRLARYVGIAHGVRLGRDHIHLVIRLSNGDGGTSGIRRVVAGRSAALRRPSTKWKLPQLASIHIPSQICRSAQCRAAS